MCWGTIEHEDEQDVGCKGESRDVQVGVRAKTNGIAQSLEAIEGPARLELEVWMSPQLGG